MKKDKTLLILAAGMGSRFGGLKQIAPVGPNDEAIIDYSIYDAIKTGFNKIVFIIRKETEDIFKEKVGNKVEEYANKKGIEVKYVFQTNENIPKKYQIPEDRVKPLGTAHAILCAKDVINEPFMIINADDFYGRDAFIRGCDYLEEITEDRIGLVTYNLVNTLTENGEVKRGIVNIKNGYLDSIDESRVSVVHEKIKAISLVTGTISELSSQKQTNMNMICFPKEIFKYIDEKFIEFLEYSDLSKDEFLIPNVLTDGIKENKFKVKVLDTTSRWVGMTYKEDIDMVKFYISSLIEDKEYPNNLWD